MTIIDAKKIRGARNESIRLFRMELEPDQPYCYVRQRGLNFFKVL